MTNSGNQPPGPPPFSPWEHLQRVMMDVQNRRVRRYFPDLVEIADDQLNLSTPRQSLLRACLLRDDDSAIMTLCRLWLADVSLGGAASLQRPVYGIPTTTYQEMFRFKPQIQLYFQEDVGDVETGYAPVTGEISFRLMRETEESITNTEARNFALRINSLFGSGGGFVWRKGRIQCVYTDKERGYALRLLCRTKAEGRRIIEQILDIQNHTPQWRLMNVSQNENEPERFPTIPRQERRLGQLRRMPRARPIADVRFQTAYLHIHGLPNSIVLVDRNNMHRNALVRAS